MGRLTACLAAAILLLAGCSTASSKSHARGGSAAPARGGSEQAGEPTSTTSAAPTGDQVAPLFVDNGVALVSVSPPVAQGAPRAHGRIYYSSDLIHWADVTPPAAEINAMDLVPTSAFFLDADHGWVAYWNQGNLGLTLFRTLDAGRHWLDLGVNSTQGFHAGDSTTFQFLSPEVGYRVTVMAAAPFALLDVSRDGGRTWSSVEDSRSSPLPSAGKIVFSDLGHAVDWGGCFGGSTTPLYHTTNGRAWSPSSILGLPAGASDLCVAGQPRLMGDGQGEATLIMGPPGPDARLVFLVTTDAGTSFHLQDVVPQTFANFGGSAGLCPIVAPDGEVSPDGSWWVAGSDQSGRPRLMLSNDRGAHWTMPAGHGLLCPLHVYPVNSVEALGSYDQLTSASPQSDGSFDQRMVVTRDGGETWSELDPGGHAETAPSR